MTQLEQWMRERMDAWKAAGGTIEPGAFMKTNNCRCAISACLPDLKVTGYNTWIHVFYTSCPVFVSPYDVSDIISGFDDDDGNEDSDYYKLGQRLAAEYL